MCCPVLQKRNSVELPVDSMLLEGLLAGFRYAADLQLQIVESKDLPNETELEKMSPARRAICKLLHFLVKVVPHVTDFCQRVTAQASDMVQLTRDGHSDIHVVEAATTAGQVQGWLKDHPELVSTYLVQLLTKHRCAPAADAGLLAWVLVCM